MNDTESSQVRRISRGPVRPLLGIEWPLLLAAGAVTIGLELGAYGLILACGGSRLGAVLASLAVMVSWTALSPAVLAAGGRSSLSALLRGVIVADASTVTLVVFWLATPAVTFLAAVKVYCTLAAMAIAAVAAVRCARSEFGRYALAVAVAAGLMAAVTTPFWVGGLLLAVNAPTRPVVASLAVWLNPFYCITAATVEKTHFIWHQAPVMYHVTRIGDYAAAPPVLWYTSAAACAALAAILTGANGLVSIRSRRTAKL
ncbi:MAG: hypothetical protein SVT52_00510 [Planctomycetota bacterium]|nr:hypothetical protein [Planctomycetota bacterium]